ncbi:unnamed protein product [Penicillium nalgiovense]|uniref:Uncharacterized protein n=1 Tax=Penicillium nalgiovense TaxID=60175 RepID=A0A1V6YZW4_PENNA|nr:hypothetical protein PENNAL_c0006G03164 [Penicillium nalgiovense]CAG8032184.1 unnamed protein product [Penicillium nalgiovense]CAG8038579.1 unnamed protein product [Penicillium nalgiovense]CAG8147645.1 unnamed protein product [Penicillium nalgiovense]CAG8227791.1 unnamed protein product [Penicillium nalgiovense]
MSSQRLHLDAVNNDPRATTGGPNPTSESSQRAHSQREALVVLNDVIRRMILERNKIETEILRQRAVLADQMVRLSTTEENIQSLQEVWENMATGFGLSSTK